MSRATEGAVLERSGLARLPRINLLPVEIEVARRLRRVKSGLAGLVVLAVLAVGLLFVLATGSVLDANGELDEATARQTSLQRDVAKYKDVTATYRRVAESQAMLQQALGSEVRFSRLLNDLSIAIPTDVWVTAVTWTQAESGATAAGATATAAGATATAGAAGALGTVTFSGVAMSHDGVATWLESFSAQTSLTNSVLQSESEALIGGKKVVTFSSTANISLSALSGRFLKSGG